MFDLTYTKQGLGTIPVSDYQLLHLLTYPGS